MTMSVVAVGRHWELRREENGKAYRFWYAKKHGPGHGTTWLSLNAKPRWMPAVFDCRMTFTEAMDTMERQG